MTELSPKIFTLSNGIRVVYQHREHSLISHCCLMINAGSRDEKKSEQGLAHFIEHGLFKGTQKRKAFHILNRLDSVGGEINASTTKEDTSVYASFLNEYFPRALDLITDITFRSTFPEKEMLKEKDVIFDEINSYLDNPGEAIFDDFEEQVFNGHAIGRNILGTRNSVGKLSQSSIFKFIDRSYSGDQIVFSFVGSLPFSKFRKEVEKELGSIPKKKNKNKRDRFRTYKPKHIVEERNLHQAHTLIGNIGFDAMHEKRHELIFLNNYLGGPAMNSILSLKVREKHGIAYYIESGYTSYSDTGLFTIYMGTDKSQIDKARDLVMKELKVLREKKLGMVQLNSAKKQLIGHVALAQDSGLNICLSFAKSLLLYNKISSTKEILERIEAINANDLLETANIVFNENKLSSLTFI
ncbi:MAG: insulinase family protein [Flavobacteriales bacterium]|nr:insulinase family protein [Flavobacteriales bacterium]